MAEVKMGEYGKILTARPFGKNAAENITKTISSPYSLDFSGVTALGSSFGDEIFKMIKRTGQERIEIKNANIVVIEALKQISKDFGLEIVILDGIK